AELFGRNFAGFSDQALLRDAWVEYLDRIGLASGQTRYLAKQRREFVLVPWEVFRDLQPEVRMTWGRHEENFQPKQREPSAYLMPWQWMRQNNGYPFDILSRDEAGYRGPIDPVRRGANSAAVPERRLLAFHHML